MAHGPGACLKAAIPCEPFDPIVDDTAAPLQRPDHRATGGRLCLPARAARRPSYWASILGEVALFSFGVGGLQFDNQGFDRQLLRMASGFWLGCVLRVGFDHQLVRRMRGDGLMVAMIAAALMVLLIGDPSLSLPFLAVIVVTACRPGALTRLLLANPVALWLGRLSFSIYMVHFPIMVLFGYVQHRAGGAVPGWASTLATLLATCVAASLICRWIEEPARRFGRRLTEARLPLAPTARNR